MRGSARTHHAGNSLAIERGNDGLAVHTPPAEQERRRAAALQVITRMATSPDDAALLADVLGLGEDTSPQAGTCRCGCGRALTLHDAGSGSLTKRGCQMRARKAGDPS